MRKTSVSAVLFLATVFCLAPRTFAQQIITTIAGGGPNHLPALQAGIGGPTRVAMDSSKNLYFTSGDRVFRIDASGQLTIVAGDGSESFDGDGGPATSASFNVPTGLFVDRSGNIFIADTFNDRIREIVAATGIVKAIAGTGNAGFSGDGGPATAAQLDSPEGVFVDGSGNIFIADTYNQRVREIVASSGNIQTVAGNGTPGYSGDGSAATSAELNYPADVAVDVAGNVFISDDGNNRIRKVIASSGNITTVAGNGAGGFNGDGGPATGAELNGPQQIYLDGAGNLFIADENNDRIREVVSSTSNIQTVAGSQTLTSTQAENCDDQIASCFSGDGGPAASAQLFDPEGVLVDSSGNLFLADTENSRIREVAASGLIQTIAGNGTGTFSGDGNPAVDAQLTANGIFVDAAGNLLIADWRNGRIRKVDASTGIIETIAGIGNCSPAAQLSSCRSGDGGPATAASLYAPDDVFEDDAGNIFIADTNNHLVREIVAASGNIQTIAGVGVGYCDYGVPPCPPQGDGGPATAANLSPNALYVDHTGNIFIADNGNSENYTGIREITNGIIQTLANIGNPANSFLTGLAEDSAGNLFVADSGLSNRVWEVLAGSATVQTPIGNGRLGFSGDGGPAASASLNAPSGVFVDSAGNAFIADTENNRVREVDAATGNIQTVVGNGAEGHGGDGGSALNAELSLPTAVWGDHNGHLLIADGDRIRSVSGLVAVLGLTVSPNPVTLGAGATQQFTATVTSAQNTSVNWTLSGSGCSGSACGTISQQGLYTAPSSVSSTLTITVTATSVADSTKSAAATITVNPPTPLSVQMNEDSVSLSGGQIQQFSVTVTGSSNSSVTWSFSPQVGTLTQAGVYTAPTSIATQQTIVVTATSVADTTKSASAMVILNPPSTVSTTTTVVSSANPSTNGQAVTFTTIVSSTSSAPASGSVSFLDNGAPLGNSTLNASAQATFAFSSLADGAHSITAQYAGDATHASSTSAVLTQTVNSVSTKSTNTILTALLNPSVGGQAVSLTATVAGASGTPTGTVTFLDGGTAIGTGVLNAGGVVSLTTSSLTVAVHTITAHFSGDANFAGSISSALQQSVLVAGFAAVTPQAVTPGQTLTVPLTFYEAPGSNLTFTFGCSGLPAQSSCTFSPSSAMAGPPPNGTPIQMMITTTAASSVPAEPASRWPLGPSTTLLAALALVLASAIMTGMQFGSRRRWALGACGVALCAALMVAGCGAVGGATSTGAGASGNTTSGPGTTGSSAGTPAGAVAITVTATSGPTTVAAAVPVTVK